MNGNIVSFNLYLFCIFLKTFPEGTFSIYKQKQKKKFIDSVDDVVVVPENEMKKFNFKFPANFPNLSYVKIYNSYFACSYF